MKTCEAASSETQAREGGKRRRRWRKVWPRRTRTAVVGDQKGRRREGSCLEEVTFFFFLLINQRLSTEVLLVLFHGKKFQRDFLSADSKCKKSRNILREFSEPTCATWGE